MGTSTLTVRRAEPSDEEFVVRSASDFLSEVPGASDLDFDAFKISTLFHQTLRSPGHACCFVLVSGVPVGMIAGHCSESLFSRQRIAQDIVLWVQPESRSYAGFRCLVGEFRRWAVEEARADLVGVRCFDEKVVTLLKRCGMSLREFTCMERLV